MATMATTDRRCANCGAPFIAAPFATKHAATKPHYPPYCPTCEARAEVVAEIEDGRSVADPWNGVVDREQRELYEEDVPLAAVLLDGRTDLTLEHRDEQSGEMIREPAPMVAVSPGLFRQAAWYKHTAARLIQTWRAGNLEIWTHPARTRMRTLEEALTEPTSDETDAVVKIRDEQAGERFETIAGPTYRLLRAAMEER